MGVLLGIHETYEINLKTFFMSFVCTLLEQCFIAYLGVSKLPTKVCNWQRQELPSGVPLPDGVTCLTKQTVFPFQLSRGDWECFLNYVL